MHPRSARRPRRLHQRRIAVHADRIDGPVCQRTQQPAFTATQVEHTLGLATQRRQQDGLVGDLEAAFDGAATDGLYPGAGIVLPALQKFGIGGGHGAVRGGVAHKDRTTMEDLRRTFASVSAARLPRDQGNAG
ncbi:hypothetical protein D9M72_612750 [compost metagenome]